MSKSMLVMDTPKSCDRCNFYDEDYCGVPGCGEEVGDYIMSRPDWCPLQEVPEKKPYNGEDGITGISLSRKVNEALHEAAALGWNACIDEILKECE